MADRPPVNNLDWITIGAIDCVVANVRQPNDPSGDVEVVFNPQKPTNDDARWTGDRWQFVSSQPTGGLADRYPRLADAVSTLKRGRYAKN